MSVEKLVVQNHERPQNIKDEFANELMRILKQPFFSLVYGSFASKTNTPQSDLDVILGLPKEEKKVFLMVRDLLIDLHKKYNLCLDNEIPYEKKLLVPYKDFFEAAQLSGFEYKNQKIHIPEVIKSEAFLSGNQMRNRLLFNILTVPTIPIWNDMETLTLLIQQAEFFLVLLWLHLLGKEEVKVDDFILSLLYWKNNSKGEFYLGYKNNPQVINHLKAIFLSCIERLESDKILKRLGDDIYLVDQDKISHYLKTKKSSFV